MKSRCPCPHRGLAALIWPPPQMCYGGPQDGLCLFAVPKTLEVIRALPG